MKNIIPVVFILLLAISCTTLLENRQANNEAAARSLLVGKWKIKSFSIRSDYYTQQVGIQTDTTLFDFGTIEFMEFRPDTLGIRNLTAPMKLIHKNGTAYDGFIEDLIGVGRDEIWIRTRYFRLSEDWNTEIGQLLEASNFFIDNYRVDFIDDDNIEINSEGVNRTDIVVLERIE
jgi:hypothetical protein